jgi:hypothetical protein
MILLLNELKYYFLTYNNTIREKHMYDEFTEYDILGVESIKDTRNKSGSSGFLKLIDIAIKNNDSSKKFQPFVLFEDDIKKYRNFPDIITIPDNTDILYIGLSACGMMYNNCCSKVCYKNINEDIIKIFNMLSSHGFIICSLTGLLAFKRCFIESYNKNIAWDIFIAQIQPFYNIYALKIPLVYQSKDYGGQENLTKITYSSHKDVEMDNSWINESNISIIKEYIQSNI